MARNARIRETRNVRIRGAAEHNLKSLSCTIPLNALTVVTGPSGAGKSSLVFDVLVAEGRRRMALMRDLLHPQVAAPNVESIENLGYVSAPAQGILTRQQQRRVKLRETIGSVSGLTDFFGRLFAEHGEQHCLECGGIVLATDPFRMAELVRALPDRAAIIAMVGPGEFAGSVADLERTGFSRVLVGDAFFRVQELPADHLSAARLGIVVEFFSAKEISDLRIQEAFQLAKRHSSAGFVGVGSATPAGVSELMVLSETPRCEQCGAIADLIQKQHFDFQNEEGACPVCRGEGILLSAEPELLIDRPERTLLRGACKTIGERELAGAPIHEWAAQAGVAVTDIWREVEPEAQNRFLAILAEALNQELKRYPYASAVPQRLRRYLQESPCSLCLGSRVVRAAGQTTLSGKTFAQLMIEPVSQTAFWFAELFEQQLEADFATARTRLESFTQLGLDYLSLAREISTLSRGELSRLFVVRQQTEALQEIIYAFDEVSSGLHPAERPALLTALRRIVDGGNTVVTIEHDPYFVEHADYVIQLGPGSGNRGGELVFEGVPKRSTSTKKPKTLKQVSKTKRNSKSRWFDIPVTAKNNLKPTDLHCPRNQFVAIVGASGSGKSTLLREVIVPALSRNYRRHVFGMRDYESAQQTVLALLGIDLAVAELLASTAEARVAGLTARDILRTRPTEVRLRERNLNQILEMSVGEAMQFFARFAPVVSRLQLADELHIEYLTLGERLSSLSSGEFQRTRLARVLGIDRFRESFFALDEPSSGLHGPEIEVLIRALDMAVDRGHSVFVVDHRLELIRAADYIIELGPGGGENGGAIIANGTPDEIKSHPESRIAEFL